MEMKTSKKKGITLISLVITIIVLLILATVAITLAVDSDGLFEKAGTAANTWNTAVAEEETKITNLLEMANTLRRCNFKSIITRCNNSINTNMVWNDSKH